MPRLRAASSRIHSQSLLPSREHAWLRVALIGAPLVAFTGAVVSVALAPAIGPGLVLAGILLPAIIVGLLGAALWRRPYLFAAAVMINIEAIVAGAVLPDGIAVAVARPMVSIALVQGSLDSRQLRLASIAAVVVASRRGGAGRVRRAGERPVHGNGDGRDDRVVHRPGRVRPRPGLALHDQPARGPQRVEVGDRRPERRRGELERTSSLLSAIVDASPLATQAFTLDRTVTIWNPASERIFGWTAEELIGHPMPTAMVPEDERADLRANGSSARSRARSLAASGCAA